MGTDADADNDEREDTSDEDEPDDEPAAGAGAPDIDADFTAGVSSDLDQIDETLVARVTMGDGDNEDEIEDINFMTLEEASMGAMPSITRDQDNNAKYGSNSDIRRRMLAEDTGPATAAPGKDGSDASKGDGGDGSEAGADASKDDNSDNEGAKDNKQKNALATTGLQTMMIAINNCRHPPVAYGFSPPNKCTATWQAKHNPKGIKTLYHYFNATFYEDECKYFTGGYIKNNHDYMREKILLAQWEKLGLLTFKDPPWSID